MCRTKPYSASVVHPIRKPSMCVRGEPPELIAAQQQHRRSEANAPVPQPRAEIVNQQQRAETGEHCRQHETPAHRANRFDGNGHDPEEDRRFIRIDFAGPMRHPPLSGLQHFQRHAGEADFIDMPRHALAKRRAKNYGSQRGQCPAMTTRARQHVSALSLL
jgi:hypothetical protein